MASFQAKIGWKRPRNRENKNCRSVSFPPNGVIENYKKVAKIFKKLKNHVMASFQAKIGLKRLKKKENKNYRFVSCLHDA